MSVDLLILAYVPPPGGGRHPESFLANLAAYKTGFELSLFSSHPEWNLKQCPDPTRVRNRQFGHWVSNFTFFLALQYAIAAKATYFLLLEDDCRVRGDYWDMRMLEEAMNQNPNFAAAGSSVCYNPSGSGHQTLKLATQYACEFLKKTGLAMPIYGYMPGIALYPNGAGGIYRTEIMERIFRGFHNDIARASQVREAWDIHIGKTLYEMYGDEIFNLVTPISCAYSGCTNDLIAEPERIRMLESGEKLLIHQVKGPYR